MVERIYCGRFVSVPSMLPRGRQDLKNTPFPYEDPSLEEAVSKRRVYVRAENANLAALLMIGVYAQREKEWVPSRLRSRDSIIVARYIGTLKELKIRNKVKSSKIK